jgi:hypothetical protein
LQTEVVAVGSASLDVVAIHAHCRRSEEPQVLRSVGAFDSHDPRSAATFARAIASRAAATVASAFGQPSNTKTSTCFMPNASLTAPMRLRLAP